MGCGRQRICRDTLKSPHYLFSFRAKTLCLNNQKILILSIVPFLKEFIYNSNGSKHTYLDYGQNHKSYGRCIRRCLQESKYKVTRICRWFGDENEVEKNPCKLLCTKSPNLTGSEVFPSQPHLCVIFLIIPPPHITIYS